MKLKTAQTILFVLLGFLGIGALGGGGVLILSPSGKWMGMPLSLLEHSPFPDFLIPGILLFVVLGLLPVLLIYWMVRKTNCLAAERLNFFSDMRWQWSFCIYLGFALIIWIQIEMIYLQVVHWLHTFYMFYAIALIFTTLLPSIRLFYKKD